MKITLTTLAEATQQQVFDQVATHLLVDQREKSYTLDDDGDDQCAYKMEDDKGNTLKCAVGCLISDDEYVDPEDLDNIDDEDWFM